MVSYFESTFFSRTTKKVTEKFLKKTIRKNSKKNVRQGAKELNSNFRFCDSTRKENEPTAQKYFHRERFMNAEKCIVLTCREFLYEFSVDISADELMWRWIFFKAGIFVLDNNVGMTSNLTATEGH